MIVGGKDGMSYQDVFSGFRFSQVQQIMGSTQKMMHRLARKNMPLGNNADSNGNF